MKLSKDAFFCFSDEKAEELMGKQVTVQMLEPRELIKGTVTGLQYMDPIMYETYKHIRQTKYMGIIINNEIQLKFDANIDYIIIDEKEDVISRRKFFKEAAGASLPIIAGSIFFPFIMSSCDGAHSSCVNCANGCDDTCYHSCKGCTGTCRGACQEDCFGGCMHSCGGVCSDTCSRSCKTGCRGGNYNN